MLTDTHPDAERVQIELIRKASVAERIRRMRSLTSTMINLSRQAIAKANPGLVGKEFELKCVELYYGKELARKLRDYLDTE